MNSQAYTNLLEVHTSVALQTVAVCIVDKNLFQMCCTPTCTPSNIPHTGMHKCVFVRWTPPSMASLTAIIVCNGMPRQFILWMLDGGHFTKICYNCMHSYLHSDFDSSTRPVWSYKNLFQVCSLFALQPVLLQMWRLSYDQPLQAWYLWILWLVCSLQ